MPAISGSPQASQPDSAFLSANSNNQDQAKNPDKQSSKSKTNEPKPGGKTSLDGDKNYTSADVENPKVLLAEAIGHQAITLSRTNKVLKFACLGLAASTLISTMFAYSAFNKPAEFRYFFMGSSGEIIEAEPLDQPSISLNIVRDFYAESLSHMFSFHYQNFDMHYQRLAPSIMTERAMLEFSREIDRIGLIPTMKQNAEVAEAVILQTPILHSSGVDPKTGLYTWELSVPFNLTLESGLRTRNSNNVRQMGGVARVQIIRVEPSIHPRGFLINRITIRDTGNR
jgi:hypothetical protein